MKTKKLRCIYCHKMVELERFDVNCNNGKGYLDGDYAYLFRCPKCRKMQCYTLKELNDINLEESEPK